MNTQVYQNGVGKPFFIFGLTFYHEDASFKIGTDALLLSAVIRRIDGVYSVLDVGCGCGIIGLSFIGKYSDAHLTGVDIHEASVARATANAALNGLGEKSLFLEADFSKFSAEKKFDLVVSNPPYFENHLKSNLSQRNLPRHFDGSLTYELLINKAANVCNKYVVLILPWMYRDRVITAANSAGLMLWRDVHFRSKSTANPPVRSILVFCKTTESVPVTEEHYIIRAEDDSYHSDYQYLIKG